jgi:two-component system, response regulator PdtaR
MKKILIVEDELLTAEHIAEILEEEGYEICGIAQNRTEALELFKKSLPDLIIFDVFIKGSVTGIELAKEISGMSHVPFIFLTAFSDSNTLKQAAETNSSAYLIKPFTAKQLVATVAMVLMSATPKSNQEILSPPTKREKEVLELLAKGNTSRQIAQILSISEMTVQTHRKNMMSRYHTFSSNELIAIASKYQWIKL